MEEYEVILNSENWVLILSSGTCISLTSLTLLCRERQCAKTISSRDKDIKRKPLTIPCFCWVPQVLWQIPNRSIYYLWYFPLFLTLGVGWGQREPIPPTPVGVITDLLPLFRRSMSLTIHDRDLLAWQKEDEIRSVLLCTRKEMVAVHLQ